MAKQEAVDFNAVNPALFLRGETQNAVAKPLHMNGSER